MEIEVNFKMKSIASLLIIYTLIISCTMNKTKSIDLNQPRIQNGQIEGVIDTNTGLHMFYGIPYAKPPVGNLRWKAPEPLDNWEGIKETKSFGDRPMQVKLWDDLNYRSEKISEDCLYLNVWTPAKDDDDNLPVLVYIHGGGLMAGDGSELRYDGASMAQQGIVVVTINYRLNIFGFLAHPDLSAASDNEASGNYGLMDQIAALKWVKENISAFGGNPSKITIAGESAGSTSVSTLMASPLSSNLISGAIGESGAAINPTLFPRSLAEGEKIAQDFIIKSGYDSFEEFAALSADEIFDLYKNAQNLYFLPVIDGYVTEESLTQTFNSKKQAQIPLLLGWNSAELPAGAFMQGAQLTQDKFITRVENAFGQEAKNVLNLYPHSDLQEIERSATDLASDGFISYSTWKWFDLHRKNSDQNVYRYLYSKKRPALVNASDNDPVLIGAPHACEIEYCMGNLDRIKSHAWTADDYKVSETMLNYFANFIKSGNPNGGELPHWSAVNSNDESPLIMNLDTESKEMRATNDARYVFWDKYYGNNTL